MANAHLQSISTRHNFCEAAQENKEQKQGSGGQNCFHLEAGSTSVIWACFGSFKSPFVDCFSFGTNTYQINRKFLFSFKYIHSDCLYVVWKIVSDMFYLIFFLNNWIWTWLDQIILSQCSDSSNS